MDYARFFSQDAERVARSLLGRTLMRRTKGGATASTIVLTAPYNGFDVKSKQERNGTRTWKTIPDALQRLTFI